MTANFDFSKPKFVIVFNVFSLSIKCRSNSNFGEYSAPDPNYIGNIEQKSRKILK